MSTTATTMTTMTTMTTGLQNAFQTTNPAPSTDLFDGKVGKQPHPKSKHIIRCIYNQYD